jgi:hypothetical protein
MKRIRFVTSVSLLCMTLTIAPHLSAQNVTPLTAPGATPGMFKTEPAIVVGGNVQASKAFGGDPHNEIHVAANPRNPLNLVGGAMVWNQKTNLMTVVAYASFDGGKTWTPTLTFDDEYFHSDPAAGFSPDGTAFFLQITNTSSREPKYFTHVYRSKDGGKTWLKPTVLPMYDRHYIAFNGTKGEHKDWLYLNGSSGTGVNFGRSKDGGGTFEEKRFVAKPPAGKRMSGLAPLITLSDGKIVIPFHWIALDGMSEVEGATRKAHATLNAVVSENNGDTFSEPVMIADMGFGHMLRSNPGHFSSAVDPSNGPFKDRVYVVWTDSYNSGGAGVSSKKVNGSNVLLSHSADGGKTWAKPILINDDATQEGAYAAVHFQPVVAANRDGVVGVMWYDRRDSTNGIDYTTRFTASLDGGNTFLPSVKVAEAPFAYSKFQKQVLSARPYGGGQRPMNRNYWGGTLRFDLGVSQFDLAGGHTAGMAADAAGRFHPFWVDNRTGVAQIWTAAVTVNRKAVTNGSDELAALQDLSGDILLQLRNPRYDLASGRLLVDATITNVSTSIMKSPLKLRVVVLEGTSGGTVQIVNADNRVEGIGAVWDFSPLVGNNELKPNEASREKTLELQVSNAPTLTAERITANGWRALQLVHLEARLLGNIEKTTAARD